LPILYVSGPSDPSLLLSTVSGWFRLAWTDPGGTRTAWRIYYRRNGSATWLLYQDNVALASNAGIYLMDELALGVAYDFAVSAINGTTGEGPMSAAVLNIKIAPTAWTAMLHLAGAGAVAGNAVALTSPLPPTFIDHTDRTLLVPFGQSAGVTRWGPADWHSIDLRISLPVAGGLSNLIALLNQAQLGRTLYFRDVYGDMMTVSPAPGWKSDILAFTKQDPSVYRYLDLHLDQVANPYQPSVARGSALGFRALTAGSVVPLDVTESAA
jgi:hypothetical protein